MLSKLIRITGGFTRSDLLDRLYELEIIKSNWELDFVLFELLSCKLVRDHSYRDNTFYVTKTGKEMLDNVNGS